MVRIKRPLLGWAGENGCAVEIDSAPLIVGIAMEVADSSRRRKQRNGDSEAFNFLQRLTERLLGGTVQPFYVLLFVSIQRIQEG